MSRSNLSRVISASDVHDTPVFNLTAYEGLGEGCYRATFSSTKRSIVFPFEAYRDKVLETTNGKMSLAANSLFKSGPTVYRGILVPQSESIRYEEDKLKEQGFKSLRAGLFEAGEKKEIWKLVGEGDARQLVRVEQEDYDRLLQARRSSMSLVASDDPPLQPKFGDYAYAYIPELRAFDFGIFGSLNKQPFIVSRKHKRRFKIQNAQVLEAAAADRSLAIEMGRKWDEMKDRRAQFAEYLEFLAKLYGKNSEYYRANEEAILNSRVM